MQGENWAISDGREGFAFGRRHGGVAAPDGRIIEHTRMVDDTRYGDHV